MYIAAMTPSRGKRGGYNVLVLPKHEFLDFLSELVSINPDYCYEYRRSSTGKYWMSEAAVGRLTLYISKSLIGDEPPRYASSSDKLTCFGAMYLRDNAPWDVVQATYRALSKTAHPDFGGSHERMVRLNEAYEACKKARGK